MTYGRTTATLCPRCREIKLHVPAGAPDIAVCDECKAQLLTEEKTGTRDDHLTANLEAFEELLPTDAELRERAAAEADHYEHILALWRH